MNMIQTLLILVVVGAAIIGIHSMLTTRANYKKFDFNWYRSEFPNLITNQGVKCYKCGSERMVVKKLMEHSYTKAHCCGRCGQRLYYSKE